MLHEDQLSSALRDQIANTETFMPEEPQPLICVPKLADPYPIEALGSLAEVAQAVHRLTRAPEAICAQSLLATVSLCVQAHGDIELPTGQAKPVSCFFLTCASSGERKSAADDILLQGVSQYESSLRERYNCEIEDYQNRLDVWDVERKSILGRKSSKMSGAEKTAALEALGPKPQGPIKPALTFPEPTIEGLIKYLPDASPSLGIFSQEGGSFTGGYGMSDERKMTTAAQLSQFWDGFPIKRLRAGDGAQTSSGRRLSFHIMAQPDITAKFLCDRMLVDQGLTSRILMSAPDQLAGTRFWREPSQEDRLTVSQFNSRTVELLGSELPLKEGSRNELEPKRLKLGSEARQMWIEFHDHNEGQLGDDQEVGDIRSLLNKLPEHAARLAALLALYDDLAADSISLRHMASGIKLAQHYAKEIQRLRRMAEVSDHLRIAQTAIDWIYDKWDEPMISIPDLCQKLRKIRDASTARKVANTLCEYGCLSRLEGQHEVAGKRRSEVFMITPRRGNVKGV